MIRIAHADPTGAGFLGFVHGNAIRSWPDNQPQTVVAINGRRTHRRADYFDLRFWIDCSGAEQLEIAVQPSHAMRIDASEVCTGQHIGSLLGVLFGTPEVEEHACTEFS